MVDNIILLNNFNKLWILNIFMRFSLTKKCDHCQNK